MEVFGSREVGMEPIRGGEIKMKKFLCLSLLVLPLLAFGQAVSRTELRATNNLIQAQKLGKTNDTFDRVTGTSSVRDTPIITLRPSTNQTSIRIFPATTLPAQVTSNIFEIFNTNGTQPIFSIGIDSLGNEGVWLRNYEGGNFYFIDTNGNDFFVFDFGEAMTRMKRMRPMIDTQNLIFEVNTTGSLLVTNTSLGSARFPEVKLSSINTVGYAGAYTFYNSNRLAYTILARSNAFHIGKGGTLTAPTHYILRETNEWLFLRTNVIVEAGNVGIGTNSPQNLLHVVGLGPVAVHVQSMDDQALLKLTGATFGQILNDAGDLYVTANGATADLILRSGGGDEKMRVTDTGQIGIGTATPLALIHGSNSVASRVGLRVDNVGTNKVAQFLAGGTELFSLWTNGVAHFYANTASPTVPTLALSNGVAALRGVGSVDLLLQSDEDEQQSIRFNTDGVREWTLWNDAETRKFELIDDVRGRTVFSVDSFNATWPPMSLAANVAINGALTVNSNLTAINDITRPISTVAGEGGALTNVTLNGQGPGVLWLNGGTNVNFVAIMNIIAGATRQMVVFVTNLTATPYPISFSSISNNVQPYGATPTFPYVNTNGQMARISFETLTSSNVYYAITWAANPKP